MEYVYYTALNQAIELMDMCDDLEFTSALKQCASHNGVEYGEPMQKFVTWALEKVNS